MLIRLGKAGYHSFPKHLEEYAVRVHTVVGQLFESTLKNIFPILERVIFFTNVSKTSQAKFAKLLLKDVLDKTSLNVVFV